MMRSFSALAYLIFSPTEQTQPVHPFCRQYVYHL